MENTVFPVLVASKACVLQQETLLLVIQKEMTLTSINECHLYAITSQGVEFWHEFSSLKGVFSNLSEELTKPIPILFMTATATQQTTLDFVGLHWVAFQSIAIAVIVQHWWSMEYSMTMLISS